jgi:acyl-CoA synthetase (AMP-forming)/AMP-acid ligase II
VPELSPTTPPTTTPLTRAYWPATAGAEDGGGIRDTTIGSVLRDAAERAPGKIALIDGDQERRRQWTYAELLADAERAARALLTRFTQGERVAVWAQNSPEWVILEFAAALAGLTLITVNPAYQGDELAHVLGDSEADGLFLAEAFQQRDTRAVLAEVRGRLPRLRDVLSFGDWDAFTASGDSAAATERPLPDVEPSSTAMVIYTSGTTGRPKGAVLTHRGLTNNARLAFDACGIGPDDVEINPMPLFHVGGSALFTLGPVQATATQVLMPRFSPALELELIEAHRVTLLCGVPTMLMALLGHPDLAKRDVSSLRQVLTGGAFSPPALARQVEAALGVTYMIGFAQTEAGCMISIATGADPADDRAETMGRPLPHAEARVADLRTGETAGCGEVGEICARGYLVMRGYLNAPEATAAAIDTAGWLHTGDLGSMDDRGYLRIAGRLKEMIIRGGENIYPREIEEVLIAHPAVADAAVLGVPDDYYGEVIGAAVRPAASAGHDGPAGDGLAAELAEHCRARLAAAKVPVRWLVTGSFPMTASGKVRKDVLRDQLSAASAERAPGG